MALTPITLSEKPLNVNVVFKDDFTTRTHGWVVYEVLDPNTLQYQTIRSRFSVNKIALAGGGLSWHTHRRVVRQFRQQGVEPIEFKIEARTKTLRYASDYRIRLDHQ